MLRMAVRPPSLLGERNLRDGFKSKFTIFANVKIPVCASTLPEGGHANIQEFVQTYSRHALDLKVTFIIKSWR
jgi:hypothetical protein